MENHCLGVSLTPHAVRLLLRSQGVERLQATLPPVTSQHMGPLLELVDCLSNLWGPQLSVVLVAEEWGVSFATNWCTRCERDGCNAGHPECLSSVRDFEVLRLRMDAVMP